MPREPLLKKQNTGNAAVIYARYSSHNQKDASIEQQVEACMKHAASVKLNVVGTYADRAVSGKTDKRPQFQQMMKDAEQGKFSVVLAWKSNRIGRNMLQAMVNEARLRECGVKVLYTEEDFDDSAAGRFALRNMMNVNQFYIENMAEDIRRGMMDNAKQCKANGSPPYGYRIAKDKHLEIDDAQATIVREIFQKVADGYRLVDIWRAFNERGLKTRTGGQWNRSSFNKILHNERYKGIYIYKDIRVEGGIPRIISDELYFKAQEAMRMKPNPRYSGRRRANGDYLLTGKLFCGHCLSPMVGDSGTSKTGAPHFYYKCQKRKRQHACNKANVQRDTIETLIAKKLYEYCLSDAIINKIADATVEHNIRKMRESGIGALEDQLADVNKRIGNLMKAMEAGAMAEITINRFHELQDEQMRLNIKLQEAKVNVVSVSKEQLVAGMRIFRKGNIEDKKFQADLFDTFLKAAFLYDDKLRIVFQLAGEKDSLEIPIGEIAKDTGLEEIKDLPAEEFGQETHSPTMLVLSEPAKMRPVRMYQGFGVFVFDFPLYSL